MSNSSQESDHESNHKNNPTYGDKTPLPVLTRLINASRYSIQGLETTYRKEQAFRLECYAFLISIPLAFLFGDSPLEIFALIASIVFIGIIELLNTGIEMSVDRVGLEHHKLAGRAKDAASAAIFVSIILVSVFWVVVIAT